MNATPILLIVGAVTLDVLANVLLKKSDGFRHRRPGLAAVAVILLAFTLLGVAVQHMPVAVAYAAWGGLGIVTTALLSRRIDGVRLTPTAWAGVALILGSVAVLSSH
ncbi:SMR family transporter [Deinococcus depolymerans]|uniref:Spermidine export protein MdtI n=1 Tax=Deinococcus depolymerans TaxID=392408 RepID=A0ABP3LFC8_9DEIO